MSQSARTRGYYPIPDSVKATYLHKNKALFEPALTRSNNRRHGGGMVIMQNKSTATTELDILGFNQLKGHKRQLKFQKSPIHEWGLFTENSIQANEMVVEYIGEVIHQQVAKEREREYERCGIGSSFLFRVDDDTVIDATKKGSIARFINHGCVVNIQNQLVASFLKY
jgi:SET domain-containing protein